MDIKKLYQLYQQHPCITTDSRDCPEGSIFLALKGETFDGNKFALQALDKGCAYAIVDDHDLFTVDGLQFTDDYTGGSEGLASKSTVNRKPSTVNCKPSTVNCKPSTVNKKTVLVDKVTGSVWYVPGGKSTIGQMIRDAGGFYPWAEDDHSGSVSLPFEAVLEKAGEADVWLFRYSSDHDITSDELLSEHHGYRQFKAFRSGQVYGCDVERSLFYEESPFRPDWLLADFIHILHPDLSDLPPLRYYKKVKEL